MRKHLARILVVVVLAAAVATAAAPAWAGNPHFVTATASVSGATGEVLTVTWKEAGLGDEPQVHVVLSADAQCVNPGGQDPQAGNKASFTSAGDFPTQNGRAEGELSVTAVFSPSCSPPMTVRWSSIVLTDETSGITTSLTV